MSMNPLIVAMASFIVAVSSGGSVPASAADGHAGYYYPETLTSEAYTPKSERLPDVDRHRRIAFVNGLVAHMMTSPYPPQFAIFPKGTEAEKLIIVSLYDHAYNTLFRARGLLAMLTAVSRQTPFFKRLNAEDVFTFFDLLFLLGFEQITISDGEQFAHQVVFK